MKDGSLRAITRRYTLGGAEPVAIEHLGITAHDLFSTHEHNLAAPPDARYYDDTVVTVTLDRVAIPLFRRLLRQRGAAFLEDIEGWISDHENPDAPDTVRAGVMVQMFVNDESENDRKPKGPRGT